MTKGGKSSSSTPGGKGPQDGSGGLDGKSKVGLVIKEKEGVGKTGKGSQGSGGDKKDKKNKEDDEKSEPINKTDKLIKGVSPTIPPVKQPMNKSPIILPERKPNAKKAKPIAIAPTQPVTKPPTAKPPVTKPPTTKPPATKPPTTKPPVTTSLSPSTLPTCLECDDIGS